MTFSAAMLSVPHPSGMRRDGARMANQAANQAGFTLLEMAVALAVLGLIAAAAAVAYLGMFRSSAAKLGTDANLTALSDSVTAFAKVNYRLPCPDTSVSGSGYEAGAGGACPAGTEVGWFPYLSLGLPLPAPAARAIYGVFRSATVDLAIATERTGDPVGAATYANGADLVRSLSIAAAETATPVSTSIYFTGDGAASGVENCSNIVSNPAFMILAPGEQRTANGKVVDGVNAGLLPIPTSNVCFSAPTRALDSAFDDRTVAVGFYALMAKLNP